MNPLSKDYISSICEIKSMENELIATGLVDKVENEFIEVVARAGQLPIAEFGTEVKVNVFNSSSGFRVLVGQVYTSSLQFIRITDLSTLVDYERRHFFRVDTRVKCQLIFRRNEEDEERIPSLIENISLSGALLDCEQELLVGQEFWMEMRLLGQRRVFPCLVRRIVEERGKPNKYGVSFGAIKTTDADLLCAFIFECQRKEIERQRRRVED